MTLVALTGVLAHRCDHMLSVPVIGRIDKQRYLETRKCDDELHLCFVGHFKMGALQQKRRLLTNRWCHAVILLLMLLLILLNQDSVLRCLFPVPQCYTVIQPSTTSVAARWKDLKPHEASPQDIIDYFHWTNRSSCGLVHDFGGVIQRNPSGLDGQKAVCLDSRAAPRAGKCLVYSFGIHNEWSFDDAMEQYGCEVFAFDPSMSRKDHDRSPKIHFYRQGLGNRDYIDQAHWKISSLSSIYRYQLGHEGRVIDYLKIDIERAEWDVLPQILQSGMLSKIRQLAVEFHWPGNDTLDKYRSLFAILKSLEDAGMIRFDSKTNPWFTDQIPILNNYTGPVGFEIAWYQILPF